MFILSHKTITKLNTRKAVIEDLHGSRLGSEALQLRQLLRLLFELLPGPRATLEWRKRPEVLDSFPGQRPNGHTQPRGLESCIEAISSKRQVVEAALWLFRLS